MSLDIFSFGLHETSLINTKKKKKEEMCHQCQLNFYEGNIFVFYF